MTTNKEPRNLSPEKAEAILAGGMQEFLEHGYAATSMDRVAAVAGVSKATVYSHFQDKEGLFIALIEQLVQGKFRAIFDPGLEKIEAEPKIFLSTIANRILDITATEPQFLNFMRVIMGESGRFPELAQAFVRNIDRTSFGMMGKYFATCPKLQNNRSRSDRPNFYRCTRPLHHRSRDVAR